MANGLRLVRQTGHCVYGTLTLALRVKSSESKQYSSPGHYSFPTVDALQPYQRLTKWFAFGMLHLAYRFHQ
jgi:hypothetical protein